MGNGRLTHLAMRTAIVLPLLVTVSGCATAGTVRGQAVARGPESEVERGPRVRIWTTEEFASSSRVRTSFRLDDDAYVIVVNVGLDGYAHVLFPESPEDDGFVRGGRTYRLPSFFPGFATYFRGSSYRRFHNATAPYDDLYDPYAGYVFIIASWRPMHFQVAEALGLWDDYRLAVYERQLDPYVVMHDFAEQLVPGRSRDYTARFARYGAFGGGVARGGTLALCSFYGSTLGYYSPWWAWQGIGNWGVPAYGIGYYGSRSRCGYGFGYSLVGRRPIGRSVVTNPRPSTPTHPPITSGPRARPPRQDPRDPERKSRPRERARGEAEEEEIVDLTRATRALARRGESDAGRVGRARGALYDSPSDWSRSGRDAGDRTGRRDTYSGDRTRRESTRDDHRASAPRRDATPRSEPRQEARPQPAARSEPASRPAAARGERPAKPTEPH
ncbi:MAG: DUF4384 domain-containing protein [Gemmatimonadaceae bacterium]